jgi:hypothetical protein
MVAVYLTSGEKVKTPDCWANTTTEVFQRIISQWEPEKEIKDRSRLKLFNLMIGMDINPEDDAAAIWQCTKYVYLEPMDFTALPVPKTITLGGKLISFPKDLGRLKIGQNIHARQELQNVKDPNEAMSIVTAIYLQPIYDKIQYGLNESLFDFHRAKELEKLILQLPITEVYPVGFFFLKQLKNYGKGFMPSLNRMIQRKMRNVHLLLNWRKVKNLLNSVQQP